MAKNELHCKGSRAMFSLLKKCKKLQLPVNIQPQLFDVLVNARALVKKTQEPGIKLQKADFFRTDTWTSSQANSEEAPKIPLVHFFLIQDGRHHVTPFLKKTGVYPNSSHLYLCFKAQSVDPGDQK